MPVAAVLLFAGAALVSVGVALKVDPASGLIVAGLLALAAGVDAARDVVHRPPKERHGTETGRGVAAGPDPDE